MFILDFLSSLSQSYHSWLDSGVRASALIACLDSPHHSPFCAVSDKLVLFHEILTLAFSDSALFESFHFHVCSNKDSF